MREKLPDRRRCITQSIRINGRTVHFSVGMYVDGRPGEIFIDMHKSGSAVRAWCGSTAKLLSLMLQYGVPLSELVDALVGDCTEPFGRVPVSGHPLIIDTSGVLDTVMRAIALEFLAKSATKKYVSPLSSFLYAVKDLDAPEILDLAETTDDADALETFLEKFRD